MTTHLTGGCLCGAVRYEAHGDPEFSIQCCCRQCQHITGGGHASQFALPEAAVAIAGAMQTYAMRADSGNRVTSAFCGVCGSPILKRTSGFPDLMFFHAATLDDPAIFSPQKAVWLDSRQPWDHIDPGLAAGG